MGDELMRPAELDAVQEDRNEALAEVARLRQELADVQARIERADFRSLTNKDGAIELSVEPSREWMAVVASHLIDLLEVDGGPNYAQWDIKPAGQAEPYRLLLVRPGGRSAHELRREAEAERDAARAELDRAKMQMAERMWATVHERLTWQHDSGQHEDSDYPYAHCPMCALTHDLSPIVELVEAAKALVDYEGGHDSGERELLHELSMALEPALALTREGGLDEASQPAAGTS